MSKIKSILHDYSNQAIAQITGYPVEHVHMFRKNDIDHYIIRIDKFGRGIPTRTVMESRIIELITKYEKNKNKLFASSLANG